MSYYLYGVSCRELQPPDGDDDRRWSLTVTSLEDDEDTGDITVIVNGSSAINLPDKDDLTGWLVDQVESAAAPAGDADISYIRQLQARGTIQIHPQPEDALD